MTGKGGKTGTTGIPLQYRLILVIFIIAIAAIIYIYMTNNNSAQSAVAVGDNVSVYYTGKFTNGTIFSSNFGAQPLNFTVGSGQLITGFNNAVIGMKLNEIKNVTLTPSEAYGEVNQSRIVSIPKSVVGNRTISVGTTVSSGTGGQGVVTAINSTSITVDFNSPLAGKTLIFEIKVLSIKK